MAERIEIIVDERGAVTVKRNLEDIGNAADRTSRKADSMGKTLRRIGAGAAFAVLAREALKFNSAMAEVSTLVNTAEFDLRALEKAALANSKTFGSLPATQAAASYQIISAGAQSASEAIETLDAANRLAVGGVTSVEVAADGLTSVLNAYRGQIGSATDVTDALFVGMKAGKTTIEELSGSLGKVAPLAANAKVPFEELVASVAALTKGGISTKESVTGVRAILAAVVKPTQEAQEEAKRLGLQFNSAAIKSKGFAGFLNEVVEKTGGSTDSIAQLFGGVEALIPVLALAGAAGDDFNAILEQMKEKGGATEEAFNKIAKSPGFQLKRLTAGIVSEFTKFSNVLLNAAVPAITFLADATDELFRALLVVGTFLGARLASQIIPTAIAAFVSFGRAMVLAVATNPVLALAVAVTAVTATIVAFSDRIKLSSESSATAFDLIVVVLDRIGEAATRVFGFVASGLTGFQTDVDDIRIDEMVRSFGRGVDIIQASFNGSFEAIKSIVINALASIDGALTESLNGVQGFSEDFLTGLNVLKKRASGRAVTAEDIVRFDDFKSTFESTGLSAGEAFSQAYTKTIQTGAGSAFAEGILGEAEARAAGRKAAEVAAKVATTLDETGGTGGGRDPLASANQARAKAIGEVVKALGNEAEALKRTGIDRDVFVAQLALEDGLRSALSDKSLNLTEAQIESLSKLSDAERKNIDELVRGNAIKAQQQKFDEARVALTGQVIRDLKAEGAGLMLIGSEREAYQQILQTETRLRDELRNSDLSLTEAQINALGALTEAEKEEIKVLVARNREARTAASVVTNLSEQELALVEQVMAVNAVLAAAGDEVLPRYTNALRQANIDLIQFRVNTGEGSFADGFLLSLDRMTGGVENFKSKSGAAFGEFFSSVGTGFADTIGQGIFDVDNLGESIKGVARNAISQLISSLIQVGIQQAANFAVQSSLGAAATAQGTAQAATLAAAYAPAAAAASLATAGGNAVPAGIGIGTIFALIAGLVGGVALSQFADGTGYVRGPGTSRSDSIPALLSVGEAVATAQANRANPGVVDAMNKGAVVADGLGGRPVVNNYNFPPGTNIESFRRSQKQIDREDRARRERA